MREKRTNACLFRRLVYVQALCRPSSDRVASAVFNRYFSHKRQLNQCLQSYSAGSQAALCSLARLNGRTRSNIGVSATIPLSMTRRCPHSLSSADPGSPSDLLHRLLGRFTGRRAEPNRYNKDGRTYFKLNVTQQQATLASIYITIRRKLLGKINATHRLIIANI